MQAEDASLHRDQEVHTVAGVYGGQPFSVIEEFNFWRSKPELAEAVAAIKALTAVIKRSEASTMMGLEIELRNASDALKVSLIPQLAFHMFLFVLTPFHNENHTGICGNSSRRGNEQFSCQLKKL